MLYILLLHVIHWKHTRQSSRVLIVSMSFRGCKRFALRSLVLQWSIIKQIQHYATAAQHTEKTDYGAFHPEQNIVMRTMKLAQVWGLCMYMCHTSNQKIARGIIKHISDFSLYTIWCYRRRNYYIPSNTSSERYNTS